MSDVATEAEAPKGGGKKAVLVGVVLALVGASAGYYATSSGLIGAEKAAKDAPYGVAESYAFVPIEPLTIAVGQAAKPRFLRFRAELEVAPEYKAEVEAVLPRVVDVLHTYLHSITMAEIEDPSALLTLRSQMRRRIDLVVGGEKVHDLLVMEFVLN